MSVYAFIFPGQGSQYVGMGRDLAASFASAREVFDEVDDALSFRLSRLMFNGPMEELTLSANAQPALMAVSMAVMRVLVVEGGIDPKRIVTAYAGHSLGEYSALIAAQCLDIATAARLLRLRGEAMQKACEKRESGMAALLGVDLAQAQDICQEAQESEPAGSVVEIANDNGGGQVVISGDLDAVKNAVEKAKARGVRRALLLPVSGAFHSSLMAPAAKIVEEALRKVHFHTPVLPVVMNVVADYVRDASKISHLLVKQVTGTVRWRESMEFMLEHNIDSFVEIGAGKVLSGLVKRIAPDADSYTVGTPEEVEAILKIF
ncbi:ACP S-malonyltransferase [Entomobacter blattae]|uniref:Malonyl CoA-acyl carrier protein transacylase n=1 Tax=Entomobacter blattae TaxID=2762277 RepID=A0A7H1NPB7_9PROT|nr:ACP S-malonyltransferase [Entomobacter blattae]QNT77627.1 Malonyl CoA-acyl carrier protein transacylase [Entomobacter blattae]